jgi:type I restriction enzyme R subunit
VSFRNLEEATNDALALFGDKDARGIVVLKPFGDYYGDYQACVDRLLTEFPPGTSPLGEQAENAFIALFGDILRLRNILNAFDEFAGNEIIPDGMLQDYQSRYVDLYAERRERAKVDKEVITEDVVFEIELIKSVEVGIDYVLMLVRAYNDGRGKDLKADKEIAASITRAIDSSITLRSKKDLIEAFIASIAVSSDVDEEWQRFIEERRVAELDEIIDKESLRPEETQEFMSAAFRDGSVQTEGTAIGRLLPPMPRFGAGAAERYVAKRKTVVELLQTYFERFLGLG